MCRDGFLSFVLGQLNRVEALTARPMFGGVGLYAHSTFFGIVHRDILYLKVNNSTRPAYKREGMKPFKPFPHRPTTLQYYEVPVEVLEHADELTEWARHAISVAAGTPTTAKPKKRSTIDH